MYNLRDKKIRIANSPNGGRALRAISLLVEAFKSNFPDRFKVGQPPFQVMFTDGDSIDLGVCSNDPQHCSTNLNRLPPLLAHGSVHVNYPDFSFIKAFPNWFYGDCLYNWKVKGQEGDCTIWWKREGVPAAPTDWDDLIPTIVWRGSDHPFLAHMKLTRFPLRAGDWVLREVTENTTRGELVQLLRDNYELMRPRWKGVIKSILADNSDSKWINVRFHGGGSEKDHEVFKEHGVVVRDQGMTSAELAKYRYQIDFGGGGGTTWRGVLTKLAM